MADSLSSKERLFQEAFGLLRRAQYLLTEACTKHEQAMQQDETSGCQHEWMEVDGKRGVYRPSFFCPKCHKAIVAKYRVGDIVDCVFCGNLRGDAHADDCPRRTLSPAKPITSPEEPRETSARDILQRLVDTCELATGAPWPALDEARAFLSGSPEEPSGSSSTNLFGTSGTCTCGFADVPPELPCQVHGPDELSRELSPSEAASFGKTLARSPRRVPLRDSDAAFNLGVLPTEQPEKA